MTAGVTPYTSGMCAVYRCGRCGKHGHKSEHCAVPRRFEGTCSACGQYGHIWRNYALSSRGQPHLNVFTSSSECPVTDAHGADTIVIPQQQQQHHQPAVDLGGEDIPFQQSSDSMHYSNGVSGGGGGDVDAIGTGVQQQMAVTGQQSFVTVAHGSGGEDSDDGGWNSGVAWQQQLDLRHNGGVVETSGAPEGGPEGTGGTEVAPFLELFSAVMAGRFTEVLCVAACLFHHPQPLLSNDVHSLHPFREPPPGFYDISWGHRCCHPWRLFRRLRLKPTAATSVGAVYHAW